MTIDETKGILYLRLDKDPTIYNHSIKEVLNDWYKWKLKLDNDEISKEEYANWKLNYPEKSDILFNRKPPKKHQKNSSIRINGIKIP